jgi:hypothetical protein
MILDGIWALGSSTDGFGFLNAPTKSVTESVAFSCSLAGHDTIWNTSYIFLLTLTSKEKGCRV